MTMENSGHEETKPAVDSVKPPTAGNVPNPSRRRFNRAGVGASAVVMTLASRSVLANMACTTASGFHSANMSHHGATEAAAVDCNGLSYQDWMSTEQWNPPRTALFTEKFGTIARDELVVGAPTTPPANQGTSASTSTSTSSSSGAATMTSNVLKLKDATLEQAMSGSETPLVVKHLIAALLNASGRRSTNPSIEIVLKMFAEWNSSFSYEVAAGVKWGTPEIIEYLSYTQTPGMPTFPTKRF